MKSTHSWFTYLAEMSCTHSPVVGLYYFIMNDSSSIWRFMCKKHVFQPLNVNRRQKVKFSLHSRYPSCHAHVNKEIITKIANGTIWYDMGDKEHIILKFRYFSCKWREDEKASSYPQPEPMEMLGTNSTNHTSTASKIQIHT